MIRLNEKYLLKQYMIKETVFKSQKRDWPLKIKDLFSFVIRTNIRRAKKSAVWPSFEAWLLDRTQKLEPLGQTLWSLTLQEPDLHKEIKATTG